MQIPFKINDKKDTLFKKIVPIDLFLPPRPRLHLKVHNHKLRTMDECFTLKVASRKTFSVNDLTSNETIVAGLRPPAARPGMLKRKRMFFLEAGMSHRYEEQALSGAPWPTHAGVTPAVQTQIFAPIDHMESRLNIRAALSRAVCRVERRLAAPDQSAPIPHPLNRLRNATRHADTYGGRFLSSP